MLKSRRSKYLNEVKPNSVSVFFAGRAPHKSADAYYPFFVNNNFYYLSNIDQSNSALVLIKSGNTELVYLFIEDYDPIKALWDGKILTKEEASTLSDINVTNILSIKTLDQFLANLFQSSRRALVSNIEYAYFDIERLDVMDDALFGEKQANRFSKMFPFISIKNSNPILALLRSTKDDMEIQAIKGAIKIQEQANMHIASVMKTMNKESDIEAEFNYILNKNKTIPSFDTIIASGNNATTLHYIENNDVISKGDLILIDSGVRYMKYASDVTRCYPSTGKFTPRQKEIYQAVLNVNKEMISWVKPGITQKQYNEHGKSLLIKEAKRIKLIKEDSEIEKYYYHGIGHALGLDVHDVIPPLGEFKEGQVITIEPGLYVSEEKIGVRIEDNLLLVKNGCINLTSNIEKEIDDIEKIMNK